MQSQRTFKWIPIAAAVALGAIPTSGVAQSLFSEALVGAGNLNYNEDWYAGQGANDNSMVSASDSRSFTGMDGSGQTQTMSFSGKTTAQSDYGKLHVYTDGTLTNSYNNPNNQLFYDNNTENPNGSPDYAGSLGFAYFTDTLQFGGNLQAGYQARYIFELVGSASGVGVLADLGVSIAGNAYESFFEGGTGQISDTWATQSYAVNGQTPQSINVQFSDQVVFNMYQMADGTNATGVCNYGDTLKLATIEMVDANGNLVNDWTVSSASGTLYHQGAVPEPSGLVALLAGAGGLVARRRRIR